MEPTSPVIPTGLTPSTLTLPKERTYFYWVLVISIAIWLLIAVTIVGLFYAALFGFMFWLGNGLLVAHLRAEAVKVDERQMPRLAATFKSVCDQFGISHPPALYVLQAGGMLNAFATRHSGRNFVVVYSDFLEALGPDSPEMKFILGHELGHIQSRHILKHIFLGPGMMFPLVGPAYRRAWESSCDRYGAFAAQDITAATRALQVLAGGREHGHKLNTQAFADQYTSERGFFVTLHELTSTYPTLSRRLTDMLALKDGVLARRAERHPVAFLVALFLPGGGGTAAPANALVMVVIIGLLAAMAIPAFAKVREASQQKFCINNARQLQAAFDQYRLEEGTGAKTWDDIVGPTKFVQQMPVCLIGGTYSAEYADETGYEVECSIHGSPAHPAQMSQTAPR